MQLGFVLLDLLSLDAAITKPPLRTQVAPQITHICMEPGRQRD
jgi:hypothetical protein